MTKQELYLKTIFCCIACDCEIADEEVKMIREHCAKDTLFSEIDVEKCINSWIDEINQRGRSFLQEYLDELATLDFNEKEQLLLVSLAIKAIETDNCIKYFEIKFFKKIRARLSISDATILAEHPDKEDFLLPDINVADLLIWDDNIQFNKITFSFEGMK